MKASPFKGVEKELVLNRGRNAGNRNQAEAQARLRYCPSQ